MQNESAGPARSFAVPRLSHFVNGLVDACQGCVPAEDFQSLKQGWGTLTAAHGHADGLKHLSRLDSHLLGGAAEGLVQRVMFELGLCQQFTGTS